MTVVQTGLVFCGILLLVIVGLIALAYHYDKMVDYECTRVLVEGLLRGDVSTAPWGTNCTSCYTEEEMITLCDYGKGPKRDPMLGHILNCPSCRTRFLQTYKQREYDMEFHIITL